MEEEKIVLFNENTIRRSWNDENNDWFYSVVDVISILTESKNSRNYWKVLKSRLKSEGSELVTNCNQLKLKSSDGKFYLTDVLDTKGILRLIQSIPSKNAEPFKLWLAKLGGDVAKSARIKLEKNTGKKVITSDNSNFLKNEKKLK